MRLKQEFLTALRAGMDYDELLELVHQHQAQGVAPQVSYEVLQQIWQELGFDKEGDNQEMQNNLEAVMEKIWYECPA
jgi:hypothetical protein